MPHRDADAARSLSLAALLESRYDELRQFAQRRAGSSTMAEDVMQDAWLRLSSEKTQAVDPAVIDNPLGYVYRVIANLVIDRQRQATAKERYEVDEPATDRVPTQAPSPFHVVVGQQEYAVLQQAIADLPGKCRDVFLLYRAHHLTMQEIAGRLGISPKTVENHIAHAMVLCRRRLRDAGRVV